MANSIIVEFVGMPGAGKSTVCAATSDLLQTRNVRVTTRSMRETAIGQEVSNRGRRADWGSFLVEELRHPQRVASALRYMLTFSPRLRKGMAKPVWDLLRKSYLSSRHHGRLGDLTLLDQGIVQPILSISILRSSTHRTPSKLQAVVETFKNVMPDVVVYMKVDPAEAQRRLESRIAEQGTTGRFDRRLQQMGPEAFEVGQTLTEQIVGVLQQLGTQILESDASRPPNEQAGTLADELYRIHRSHQA